MSIALTVFFLAHTCVVQWKELSHHIKNEMPVCYVLGTNHGLISDRVAERVQVSDYGIQDKGEITYHFLDDSQAAKYGIDLNTSNRQAKVTVEDYTACLLPLFSWCSWSRGGECERGAGSCRLRQKDRRSPWSSLYLASFRFLTCSK